MQGRFKVSGTKLNRAARVAVGDCLQVKPGESVLIVTNPYREVSLIAQALYDAVLEAGAAPVLLYQPLKSQLDFAESAVYGAMERNSEVVISISQEKMGKDRRGIKSPYRVGNKSFDSLFHYLLFGSKSLRAFWSPSITRTIFESTVPLDYAALKGDCDRVKSLLDQAQEVQISGRGGTELSIGLRGRAAKADDGDFSRPGRGGNLPAGEVFLSPELGTARGTIGFDGSIAAAEGVILIDTPILARVEDGLVTDIQGGREAEALLRTIRRAEDLALEMESDGRLPAGQGALYRRNARNLGELGIGLNRQAGIVGNMLCDEKVYGTCHIAVGHNYDEDAPSLIHLDGLIKEPTITLVLPAGQRREIMRDGRLVD